jgi:hypothetical protein
LEPERDIAGPRQQRLAHFTAQLARPVGILAPVGTFVAVLGGEGSVLDAAGAALLVVAIIVVVAFRRSSSLARETFYDAYAGSRGLEQHPDEVPPGLTPLLCMGEHRYAQRVMIGVLPGGLNGALTLYTYVERNERRRRNEAHEFTVAIYGLPEVSEKVLELYCEPRTRSRSSSGIEGFRTKNRLQLESVALDNRYDIFFGRDDDESWLHRLYVPTFIVWLSEHSPAGFGFQLSIGYLCAFAPGHLESAASLDSLCEAATVVATRLVEEAAE